MPRSLALVTTVFVLVCSTTQFALSQTTTPVSVGSTGVECSSRCAGPSTSADDRSWAVESDAPSGVATDAVTAAYIAAGIPQGGAQRPAETAELKDLDAALSARLRLRARGEEYFAFYRAAAIAGDADVRKRKAIIASLLALKPEFEEIAALAKEKNERSLDAAERCGQVICGSSAASAKDTRAKERFVEGELVKWHLAKFDKALASAYLTAGIRQGAAPLPATTKGQREFDVAVADLARLADVRDRSDTFCRDAMSAAESGSADARKRIAAALLALHSVPDDWDKEYVTAKKRMEAALVGIFE